jgi:tRNA(Arg) A34 adenosine deaminase TadA
MKESREKKTPAAKRAEAGRMTPAALMAEAVALSLAGMRSGRGGPFGAVVARDGTVIGKGNNGVIAACDPTAHAEVAAIRAACLALGRFELDGCVLYTSCEPCPMCLAAAYWARIDRIVYANTRKDAARIGFGDDFIYREISLPPSGRSLPMRRLSARKASEAFREWERKADKVHYGPER